MNPRSTLPFALLLALPASARAESGEPAAPRPPVERSWLYLEEARVPAPLQVAAYSRATVANGGEGFTRPFAASTAAPGLTSELGGEVGLAPRLSLALSGVGGESASHAPAVGALAGARVALLPSDWSTRAVVSAGWLRELSGANGAWGRVTATQDLGRVRLATTVHGERVFASGRDGVDLMLMAGVNVRVAEALRLGVEYVAQDVEGLVEQEAEGGVRHFVGPTAAVALLGERLTLGAGPALGLSPHAPLVVGRAAVAWSF